VRPSMQGVVKPRFHVVCVHGLHPR
jgi:hypothetical protein